jgi:phosphoserine phosphatase RsbU/P
LPSPASDMASEPSPKKIWSYLGVADKVFLVLLLAYLVSGVAGVGSAARFLLLVFVFGAGVVVGIRWLRVGVRKAIWQLRNRLYVAYLFIAFVPILLIGILAFGCSWALAGQIAVYLVSSEMDRRLESLDLSAQSLVSVAPYQRERAWERVQTILSSDFPNIELLIEEGGQLRFPENTEMEAPPEGWGDISGVVVRDGLLYAWARSISGETEVTLMAPLTRQFLLSLAPGIGDVTILEFAETTPDDPDRPAMRPHDPLPGESSDEGAVMPAPRNRLDIDVKQGTSVQVAIWDSPPSLAGGLLSIHSRFSAVLDVIFIQQAQNRPILLILSGLAIIFLIVELISFLIGVSITRTITSAFSDLYEGTQHVQEGNFSHRIEVKGKDQLAEVSTSFNKMTENIERLLEVSKEKERMQAELEIAKAVQQQLYPKTIPALSKLELLALCNPARMVSGDYYDYQALDENSAVVALGDVAGKGISAALLMAAMQSSLRTHVRSFLLGGGTENGEPTMSSSTLVSRLNEQIYADTSPEKYATFFFSLYDDEASVLTYTNAGHLPPMLFRNGKVSELDVNGMVVGAFPFAQYGESQVKLESGDVLLVFTDGITEPENEYGEMFGEERVKEVVQRNVDRDLDHIIKAAMEAVTEWTGGGELQDDMTILIARRH